jgi:ABC-2 type transport system permease protein
VNGALFRHAWRSQRVRIAVVCGGLLVWGFVLPVVYARFGSQFRELLQSGLVPQELMEFGGGDIFSLPGTLALSLIHPIAIILNSIFAVGFPAGSVAGERQRGTLEIVLARPISRRQLYATLAITTLTLVGLALAALLAGSVAGSAYAGVLSDLPIERLPLLWLNAVLLFGSFASITLAASVSVDRLPPALGVGIGAVVVMYFFDVLGSLWPDAQWLQPYSLFHYFQARSILIGTARWRDFAVLAAVSAAGSVWAWVVFPRRDIAAPS